MVRVRHLGNRTYERFMFSEGKEAWGASGKPQHNKMIQSSEEG